MKLYFENSFHCTSLYFIILPFIITLLLYLKKSLSSMLIISKTVLFFYLVERNLFYLNGKINLNINETNENILP